MGANKVSAIFLICMLCMFITIPPAVHACGGGCPGYNHPKPPSTPRPHPPTTRQPPHHGGGGGGSYPPITRPPIVLPPITRPSPGGGGGGGGGGILPPIIGGGGGGGTTSPPYSGGGGSCAGGCVPGSTPPAGTATCPIDALKLGLCLDVLGGLVHVGLGNPAENVCCPVLQGLLELEAAICLCTTIRIKLLNLNIFLPLALSLLATCGLTPPPGFVCPPLV